MKRMLIVAGILCVVISISIAIFLNSDFYFSKKLVQAIEKEDVIEIQRIVDKHPNCINTYPSVIPKWLQSVMNWRVLYPVNAACYTDNVEIIKLLIEAGADVNCNDGLTPLSITYCGKRENWFAISQLLLENGAALDYITEYSGGKPSVLCDIVQIHSGTSAEDCNQQYINEVMAAFDYALAYCDHSQIEWMRVLQHSVSNSRIEIVRCLLDEGYCDVNDLSVGMTALMFAARDSTGEMVKVLLSYGADTDITSIDGKTAYDYAEQMKNNEVMLILQG